MAYSESYYWQAAVHNPYGHDAHISYGNSFVRLYYVEIDGWHAWITFFFRREAVWYAFHEMVGA